MRALCSKLEDLPESYRVLPKDLKIGDIIVTGNFTTVSSGTLDGSRVCVKRVVGLSLAPVW